MVRKWYCLGGVKIYACKPRRELHSRYCEFEGHRSVHGELEDKNRAHVEYEQTVK